VSVPVPVPEKSYFTRSKFLVCYGALFHLDGFMQKYEQIKDLPSNRFRRLTGMSKLVFQIMVNAIQTAEHKHKGRIGKPSRLKTEDKLLMTLEYLREYRTYFHLGQSYGLSESACYRNCKWVEDVLIKDKTFSLPGKKVLLDTGSSIEVILIDATETPIERPKKTNTQQEESKKSKQQPEAVLLRQKKEAHIKKPSRCMQILSESAVYAFLPWKETRF